jgi:hypothetical protein
MDCDADFENHNLLGAVSHTCNPSYSGSKDQEDCSSKPAGENRLWDPILNNPITKNWAGGVAQGKGPEFKPQYSKRKKKNHNLRNC